MMNLNKIKIKGLRAKVILSFLIVAILPAAIIGGIGYNSSKKSLQSTAIDKLALVRDTKKKDIENYFKDVESKVSYMAQDPMVINAMLELSKTTNTAFQSSDYNSIYEKYNSTFVNFTNKVEYGDILLVDSKTGNVVYSIFKEGDYKTNLLDGTYKNTNVSKAFVLARNTSDKNFTTVTDYEFYGTSNKPVACIASPIFNGNEKIGVLILKLGTEKLDAIVSNNNKWNSLNIGKSGEVLVIGGDYKLRNNTRFLNEDTDEKIKAAKSTILLKEIRTKGAEQVILGKTDTDTYFDYHNIKSIVAYTPLNIDNLKWAVLVKINESEVFQPVKNLEHLMVIIMIVVSAAIVILAFIISVNITTPMIRMSQAAFRISQGDLTVEFSKEKHFDEMAILIEAARNMLVNLREQTREIINVVNVLASSVSEITVSLTQVTSGAAETSSAVSETTATVEEIKQTVFLSSEKTKNVSNSAKHSLEISKSGSKATEETLQGMDVINSQMKEIAESIIALSEQSQNISELIESVDNISEQSNILAVNASIEAAKAGEHGKGFSIVAQEIRNLAEQSKQSTKQVRNILKDIQKATNKAVMTTEKGIKLVDVGMEKAAEAGQAIQNLMENITISAQAAIQIEASSQQQLVGMDQVAIAMEGINEASIRNLDSMKQLEEATRNLQEMGYRLKQLTEKYKV
ncbi:methyl-accepting chemotaxis protein [Clostridium sp. DJ247]|uniref:methyl-accepting chemotaxis protein n=1 Tax=Clostridium sp. DJ247 TaxID=2726188 RepID=UPI001625A1AC|nr:methyl-accepting chemotaxis protein [Clostridium sp. DJ247]MBC2581453.1 methyl-accepting chemotaxis protein [Clostridium sp. DJ247]